MNEENEGPDIEVIDGDVQTIDSKEYYLLMVRGVTGYWYQQGVIYENIHALKQSIPPDTKEPRIIKFCLPL